VAQKFSRCQACNFKYGNPPLHVLLVVLRACQAPKLGEGPRKILFPQSYRNNTVSVFTGLAARELLGHVSVVSMVYAREGIQRLINLPGPVWSNYTATSAHTLLTTVFTAGVFAMGGPLRSRIAPTLLSVFKMSAVFSIQLFEALRTGYHHVKNTKRAKSESLKVIVGESYSSS
jgi:hypothetical protein